MKGKYMRHQATAKQLTARDIEILLWIGRAGVASLDQVARHFWAGRSEMTAMERMRRLVKAGYLEMHSCNMRTPGERVFALSEQGYMHFGSAQRERLQVGLPALPEMRQQLMAQDAYLALQARIIGEGRKLVDWWTERELRARLKRRGPTDMRREEARFPVEIPDAEAVIVNTHGEVEILYVEIDGAYYGKMLWQKASGLSKSGHQVVWVCTQARTERIRQAVAGFRNIQVLSI